MSHTIEWRHDGRRIVLPVIILPPDPATDLNGIEAVALLDTGSTTSGITPRIARALDLTKRGKRPLGSAQGEGQAERYLFRVGLKPPLEQPTFPYIFGDVSGFELSDSFQLGALIGMDILRECDFEMRRDGLCRLRFGT
jgi:hypothetical protein